MVMEDDTFPFLALLLNYIYRLHVGFKEITLNYV